MQGGVLFGSPSKLAAAAPIFPAGEVFEVRDELVRAVKRHRDRGLLETVKWLCELLVCLKAPPAGWKSSSPPTAAEDDGDAVYLLGRAYFDAREYLRCHHALRDAVEPRSRFLCTYALYLAGETRRQEDAALAVPGGAPKKEEAAGSAGGAAAAPPSNPFLAEVCARVEQQAGCGFSCYLLGVCQRVMGMEEQALLSLARAVQLEPFLWAAWWELARLLCAERYADAKQGPGVDMRITALGLGRHWMFRMFVAHLKCELQSYEDSLAAADSVLVACPGSVFGRTLRALTLYNMREFEGAAALFEGMWRDEPYRIADMDVYSNVLYVRGERAKLSYLAHRVAKTDRYRPESCCIIGNYYSMRGSHLKAVSYFQRALRLNPSYLSAWTLMGHEYMELSNSVAAINCYRRAVDINDRDFRAWYALGQAYEILAMDSYALWYFHKACALRPGDARMWVALGGCFEKTGRVQDAIRSFERAVAAGDAEGVAMLQLAKLHEREKNHDRAAFFFKAILDTLDAKRAETPPVVEALLYLGKHCMSKGFWKEAEKYCFRLLDYNVPEKEEAKSLLKTIHVALQAQQ